MPQESDTDPFSDADILVLTDDIRDKSGFAVNGRLVCWALAKQWNVINAAIDGQSAATVTVRDREIDIYPVATGRSQPPGATQNLGREGMQELIDKTDPDAVISLVDVQMCRYLGELNRPQRATVQLRPPGEDADKEAIVRNVIDGVSDLDLDKTFEWVAQVPIDGHPLPESWQSFFAEVDHPVAMSEYGARVAADAFDVDLTTIRHAVDYQEVVDVDADPFMVGTVNRNQFRKQYPRLIEAWGKFYERAGRPDDVRFYIHADYQDDMGWDLSRYIKRWGLEDVMIPYRGKVARDELMQLYNQLDVFCSATGGEGFGLTTIEAMSQETPVVITDYTTSEELVADGEPSPRGSLIDPAVMYDEHPNFAAVPRALVDTDAFAETLLAYYENQEWCVREGENAREWVEEACSWNRIADQWESFVATEVLT